MGWHFWEPDMHFQSRNSLRERDHRISLMPLDMDGRPVRKGDLAHIGLLLCIASGIVSLAIIWSFVS